MDDSCLSERGTSLLGICAQNKFVMAFTILLKTETCLFLTLIRSSLSACFLCWWTLIRPSMAVAFLSTILVAIFKLVR